MKRNLFLLPVMALMLCVVACGGDDDGGASFMKTPSGVKKLKTMVREESGEVEEEWNFEYDKNGNLLSAVCEEYDDGDCYSGVYTYEWSKDGVTMSRDGEPEAYYRIVDGKIVDGEGLDESKSYSFNYDNAGYLRMYIEEYYGDYDERKKSVYTWNGGKLMKRAKSYDYDDDASVVKFTYSNKECAGFFPLIARYTEDDDPLFYAAPWLVGSVIKSLPTRIEDGDPGDEETISASYTFYADGYIKSCVFRYDYGDTETYKFSWE